MSYVTSTLNHTCYYTDDSFRLGDKSTNSNERDELFQKWWDEQIDMYGTQTDYYTRNFQLSGNLDKFYGENQVDGFFNPISLVMAISLNEDAVNFSEFGLTSDDELTAFVSISTFKSTLSANYQFLSVTEPNAGDVFRMTEYGADRPNGRNGNLFVVTERLDNAISTINMLGGHYVWKVRAKRHDYNFQPNLSAEAQSDQVTDQTTFGPTTATDQGYSHDLDSEQSDYFDYGNNDSVYGNFS